MSDEHLLLLASTLVDRLQDTAQAASRAVSWRVRVWAGGGREGSRAWATSGIRGSGRHREGVEGVEP